MTKLIVYNSLLILFVIGLILSPPIQSSTKKSISGENILKTKCVKCHGLKSPTNYTKDEWQNWVNKMAPKAKLSIAEKNAVLRLNN